MAVYSGGMGSNGIINVTFSVSGIEPLIVQLQRGADRVVSDLSEVWEPIGEDILADNAMQFLSEGGWYQGSFAGDVPWAPLAPSTIADRARKGFGPSPILWRTGNLAQSASERDAPGNIFEVQGMSLTVGTALDYAGYHQFGTRKMPRRGLIGLTTYRAMDIRRRLGDYVIGQLKGEA